MEWFTGWWDSLTLIQQVLACFAVPSTVLLFLQTFFLLFSAGSHSADHGEFSDSSSLEIDQLDLDNDFDPDFDSDLDTDFDPDFDSDLNPDLEPDFMEDVGDGDIAFDSEESLDHDSSDGYSDHDGAHHAAGVRVFTIRGLIAFFAVGGWVGIAMIDLNVPIWAALITSIICGLLALFAAAYIIKWSLKMQEDGSVNPKRAIAHIAIVYIKIPASLKGIGKITVSFDERFLEMDAVTSSDQDIPAGTAVQVVGIQGYSTMVVRPLISLD